MLKRRAYIRGELIVEEFLNLYHQKLWEVANDNIVGVLINPLILFLVLFFYPIIVYHFVIDKNRLNSC